MTTAAQKASPGVYVSDDVGIEVTDGTYARVLLGLVSGSNGYGLKVVSADGSTVIIDGTSDMFKIAATGTTSATRTGVGNVQSVVSLAGLGLPGANAPAFIAFMTEGTAPNTYDSRYLGWFLKSAVGFVAASSGGSPANGSWYNRFVMSAISNSSSGVPQIILNIDCGEAGLTAAGTMRYYILTETGI